MIKQQPGCGQKTLLLAGYQQATRAYSDAVTELNRRIGTSPVDQFETLRRKANEAREHAATALKALDGHIAEHER